MFGRGIPSLCVGLRGLAYLEVHVDGPDAGSPLGLVRRRRREPGATRSRKMIATLHDDDGRVTVPGFYDNVVAAHRRPSARRSRACRSTRRSGSRSTGSPALVGEKGYSTLERVWARPTLDCNGITGGFQGEGAKTIIPARASAKISCRLVPDQEPEDIARKLAGAPRDDRAARRARARRVPATAAGRTSPRPTTPSSRSPSARSRKAFGKPTVFMREGGSIPFVRTIADATGKPCLLMGFGQPDENAHAPNEWLDLENYHLGIKSAAYLYDEIARM